MKILPVDSWPELVKEHLLSADKPLVALLGPTAGGKTDFSIQLAKYIQEQARHPELAEGRRAETAVSQAHHDVWKDAEIINADSRQLYRYMNIGTAKIAEAEKQGIAHHLIDVLDPNEDVSIAWYKDMANAVINDCHSRNVVPILVGGSMLYISAVVDGLDPLPPPDPEVRSRLEKEWESDDGFTLYDKLVSLDPETAKNFQHQNKRYVVRAMELYEKTGVPPSQLKKTIPPPYQTLQIGMNWPREELTKRIDRRTKKLLESGWIEEVESLIDRGYTPGDPAMKSHGYKEIMQWLSSDEQDREQLAELISSKTRQYAKRQMTWWSNDDRIVWLDAKQL